MDNIPNLRPPHYENFSSISLNSSIPEAAREMLALLPASQQAEVWRRFCDIAAHGCRKPFMVVKLALRQMKRKLKPVAAHEDLRIALVIMFERHGEMLALARAAIQQAGKAVRHG